MPESGGVTSVPTTYGLGFATAIPQGYVALILPRSSTGAKYGLELNNSCGVIDSDYRGEWKAVIRTKSLHGHYTWEAGERVLQFLIVPVTQVNLELVNDLPTTYRGSGGFGSSGK